MEAILFNLCNQCYHAKSCILTHAKNKVSSCSEFDEYKPNNDFLKQHIVC